jgi:hypothetical protein
MEVVNEVANFFLKKASSRHYKRYFGWREEKTSGCSKSLYSMLFFPPPARLCVIFAGVSALRQGLLTHFVHFWVICYEHIFPKSASKVHNKYNILIM